jgi:glycosyltransferase involved in cell wall biosynthesis
MMPRLLLSIHWPLAAVLREDWQMILDEKDPIRVMRIIARMNVGGPAVQVSALMRGLNASEFDHRLYTGFCASDEADYLDTVATDVKAVRIDGFGRRVNLVGDIKAFISLVKEIRRFKPHVIHTHTAKAGFLGRIASIVSFQQSIRVHTFHGHLLNGYFGNFKRSLVVFAEKSLALFTDQLLAVGAKVRQDLLLAGIGSEVNFGLMPPGLSVGSLPARKDSCDSFGLSVNQLHCAFIGRVTQIKRPDRFLDVVAEVKNRRIDLHFFIAGDGELLDMCRKRIINENLPVSLMGWQSDIEKVLSAADIVLLTSDNEGTPLSLIQAGMSSLPVVATNVGSVPEVVLDGVTGFVTSIDVQEIADALEKLAREKVLRARFGAAGQTFTLERFSVQRLVGDHQELYKVLLTSRAKS